MQLSLEKKTESPSPVFSKSHVILGTTQERGFWEIEFAASLLHIEGTLED